MNHGSPKTKQNNPTEGRNQAKGPFQVVLALNLDAGSLDLHGGLSGEKWVETSASVCLRPVLPGRGSWTSCSSSKPGPCLASSLIAVSSRLLGEMDRCRNTPLQLASRGKNKGCKRGTKAGHFRGS